MIPPETGALGMAAVIDGVTAGAAKAREKIELPGGGGARPLVDVAAVLLEAGALGLPARFDG